MAKKLNLSFKDTKAKGDRTPWRCFAEVAKNRVNQYFEKKGVKRKNEEAVIKYAASIFGSQWREISEFVYTKNIQQCSDKKIPLIHSRSNMTRYKRWTIHEDSVLLKAEKAYGGQWQLIARHIPGRTRQQCRERLKKITTKHKGTGN